MSQYLFPYSVSSKDKSSHEHYSDPKSASADLPPPGPNLRWRRTLKYRVVDAVEAGTLALTDALTRYEISFEEFSAWRDTRLQAGRSDVGPAYGRRRRP